MPWHRFWVEYYPLYGMIIVHITFSYSDYVSISIKFSMLISQIDCDKGRMKSTAYILENIMLIKNKHNVEIETFQKVNFA